MSNKRVFFAVVLVFATAVFFSPWCIVKLNKTQHHTEKVKEGKPAGISCLTAALTANNMCYKLKPLSLHTLTHALLHTIWNKVFPSVIYTGSASLSSPKDYLTWCHVKSFKYPN